GLGPCRLHGGPGHGLGQQRRDRVRARRLVARPGARQRAAATRGLRRRGLEPRGPRHARRRAPSGSGVRVGAGRARGRPPRARLRHAEPQRHQRPVLPFGALQPAPPRAVATVRADRGLLRRRHALAQRLRHRRLEQAGGRRSDLPDRGRGHARRQRAGAVRGGALMRRGPADRWGAPAQLLHWTIVVLIVAMAWLGLTMVDMPNTPAKVERYALHKSLGLLVLALVAVRLLWRVYAGAPEPLPAPRWQRWLAQGTHFGLYVLLLAMPLSGWIANAYSGFPLRWFGLFRVPLPIAADEALYDLTRDVRACLRRGLAPPVPGRRHAVADAPARLAEAARPHARGDPLMRLPLLAAVLSVAGMLAAAPATATDYVQAEGSTLAFGGMYQGEAF